MMMPIVFCASLPPWPREYAAAEKSWPRRKKPSTRAGRQRLSSQSIPWWIILSCNAAMALGTAFGGWRIVRTMGMRITRLQPVGGFCAESAGAITLFLSTLGGIPVSTTHTITGAIVGVGATRKLSGIRWGVAGRIVWAWIFTIPASAIVAAICFELIAGLHHAL